jgi:hypothetical protein
MASFMEQFARKLGMKDPPKPKPIPVLLEEGQFGPHEGQPVASLNIRTFDVMGLGLVDPELKAAKERIVANTRKIIGEAKRAYRYAQAIQSTLIAVENQSLRTPPDQLPEEPDPIPRQVILTAYDKKEREIEAWKKTAHLTQTAAQRTAQAESIAIAKAGGPAAYAAQQRGIALQQQAAAAEKEKWTALAAAGDAAGKAWLEWQKALQGTKHAQAMLTGQTIYGPKTPEAYAARQPLQAAFDQAKALSDAWAKKFNELRIERDKWIAQQQLAQGQHPAQLRYAELVALRAASRTSPPTHHFTVAENVEQTNLHKQLIALGYPP